MSKQKRKQKIQKLKNNLNSSDNGAAAQESEEEESVLESEKVQ